MIKIVRANYNQLDVLVPLFDEYRVFYKQKSDLLRAKNFLKERFNNDESVLFLAFYEDHPVGFTQLYPTFSSVTLQRVFILNDLFVAKSFREKGVGEALLGKAKSFCLDQNCKGLALETAIDNPAQNLYEKLGWEKDSHCFHYFWTAR